MERVDPGLAGVAPHGEMEMMEKGAVIDTTEEVAVLVPLATGTGWAR